MNKKKDRPEQPLIDKFLQEMGINGMKEKTLVNYTTILYKLNEYKQLDKAWDKEDVNNYLAQLDMKESSMQIHKIVLKNFFSWFEKPELIAHLKVSIKTEPLKKENILTVEDVNKLIEATDSHFYKAIIATMFESGARINEVLNIKVGGISETDKGMIISIPTTKTGDDYRPVLAIFSAGYIRNWLAYSNMKKDDRLFPRDDCSIREMLGKIAKKAGITKPVNPHAFRHSQASDMVKRGYNESILRKKLGWTPDSKMIGRYVHLNDDDVINASLAMAGKDIPKHPIVNLKQAEPLKIADAALQLSKLSEENAELKAEVGNLKKMFEELLDAKAEKEEYLERRKRP